MRRYRGLRREGTARRVTFIGMGILLLAGGFVLGPAPIVPGFVPAVVGLAMLAGRSRLVARALDRAEVWLRGRVERVRRWWGQRGC